MCEGLTQTNQTPDYEMGSAEGGPGDTAQHQLPGQGEGRQESQLRGVQCEEALPHNHVTTTHAR